MESTDQLEGDEEGVQQESVWRRKKLDFDRYLCTLFLCRGFATIVAGRQNRKQRASLSVCHIVVPSCRLPLIVVKICNGNHSQSEQENEESLQKGRQVAGFLLADYSIGFPEHWRSGDRALQSASLVGRLSRYEDQLIGPWTTDD